MKKLALVLLSALLMLALTGCGAPADDKIKAALEDGTMTVADAKAKGWIDDAWIDAHFTAIEAGTKIHLFDKFATTYLDGTPASSDLIAGKMCLVFFDTTQKETLQKLDVFKETAAEMAQIGIPMLGIITDQDPIAAKEKLADLPFPVIVYNEAMQESLKKYDELLATDVVSVFTKDGGFYSAWHNQANKEDLLSFARVLFNEE